MLFNEKYGISHISYNTGRIIIDYVDEDNEDYLCEDAGLEGLIRGFARLIGGIRESLGMMQYRITNSPYEFVIQWDTMYGIVITVENMRKLDEIVNYVKNSIQEINYNMLYEQRENH